MTGFGSGEASMDGVSASAEVSSVNGRFLDLKVKLPKFLAEYENEVRKIAQTSIERGRVNIVVNIAASGDRTAAVRVDGELAGRYVAVADELADRFGIENNLDVRTLLLLPDVLARDEDAVDAERFWNAARGALERAFGNHRIMREREGAAIERDVRARLDAVNARLEDIRRLAPEVVRSNTDRLRKKIASLTGSDTFDEVRFAMEVALYADRLDITEECVRFGSHTALFLAELDRERTSGRKLSFLLQEMNREVNTIGSKALDAGVAGIVVLVKEELEKMREQTENME